MERFSIVLVGCGRRSREVYAPILHKMQPLVKLIGVCNRGESAAIELAAREQVPYYTDLSRLIQERRPDLAIVSVSRPNHLSPVVELIEAGISVLVETPLAETAEDMETIIEVAKANPAVLVEVAENYIRRPAMRIVRQMVNANLFGPVHLVFSHFAGHGYHGAALIRSLLGFPRPVRVTGFSNTVPVVNHLWRVGQPPRDTENWQHGVIEFENGVTGIYSFSNLTYGSPLRQEFSKNQLTFYAAKGMGVGHDVMVLKGKERRLEIPIERRSVRRQNVEILDAYVAKNDPEIAWVNPLSPYLLEENELEVALCIYDLIQALRGNQQLEYGLENGKLDRTIELMMEASWSNENKPQYLPKTQ
jgi:predicted dehydrogenase